MRDETLCVRAGCQVLRTKLLLIYNTVNETPMEDPFARGVEERAKRGLEDNARGSGWRICRRRY